MAKKKAKQPEPIDEQKALEARVDAMMDPRGDIKKMSSTSVSVDEIKEQFAKNMALPPEAPKDTTIKVIEPPSIVPEPEESVSLKTAPELPGAKTSASKKKKAKAKAVEAAAEPEEVLPQEEVSPPAAEEVELEPKVNLDDQQTDKAVDDIVVREADTVLAVEDAQRDRKQRQSEADIPKSGVLATLWLALEIVLILAIGASIAAIIMYGV